RRVPLPAYPFEGKDYWLPDIALSSDLIAQTATVTNTATSTPTPSPATAIEKATSDDTGLSMTHQVRNGIFSKVVGRTEDLSGLEIASQPEDIHLLEAGLDSLLLTQTASTLRREFQIELSFRQLLEDFATLGEVVDYIHDSLSPEQRQAFAPVEAPPAV